MVKVFAHCGGPHPEIWVCEVVDVLGHVVATEHGPRERQPQHVEAQPHHLVQHGLPRPRPQPMGGAVDVLQAVPANAREEDLREKKSDLGPVAGSGIGKVWHSSRVQL